MLLQRLPDKQDAWMVLSVVVLAVYAWMTLSFFYHLPSMILYIPLDELIAVYSYSAVGALIESALIFGAIFLFGIFFDSFRVSFVSYGSLVALLWNGWVLLFRTFFAANLENFSISLVTWIVVFVVALLITMLMFFGIRFFHRPIRMVADRAVIFLFVFLPISAVGLIIVLFRMVM